MKLETPQRLTPHVSRFTSEVSRFTLHVSRFTSEAPRLTLCALLLWVFCAALAATSASAGTWDGSYFPNVPLVTQDGQTVKLYDDLIKDKIVLINFIYAGCKEVCPLVTARMAQVQQALGDHVGRDIFLYSISLDPVHDTPDVLKQHAKAFHAGPGWLFLTGKPEDIAIVRHKLGDRGKGLSDHSNGAMAGNGATGDWERTSLFEDTGKLALVMLNMDPAFRAKKNNMPGTAYAGMSPVPYVNQPGQALFIKACASCHSIGQGDFVGPDLQGVTARRERPWLLKFLQAPNVMRAQKDPTAVALSAKFPGVMMPNLGLSEADVGDLLAYLDVRTARLAAPPHSEAERPVTRETLNVKR
ncbi:MAG: c-type cytochrome [Nitrospiraceae bacterium]|nr:c-type cytochrome [Nitrospiraceae bacterium]